MVRKGRDAFNGVLRSEQGQSSFWSYLSIRERTGNENHVKNWMTGYEISERLSVLVDVTRSPLTPSPKKHPVSNILPLTICALGVVANV
jgi:hypothetical protein